MYVDELFRELRGLWASLQHNISDIKSLNQSINLNDDQNSLFKMAALARGSCPVSDVCIGSQWGEGACPRIVASSEAGPSLLMRCNAGAVAQIDK